MGTFLKSLVYLLIIIALFFIGKGIYDGSINSQTTVGDVATQVSNDTKGLAQDAVNAMK